MAGTQIVQSLVRGMEIVQLISASGDGLTLTEIASGMSLKPSTAHNLARTLITKGFLEKKDSPVRYCLGPALGELFGAYMNRLLIAGGAETIRDLSVIFPDATITLTEAAGGEIMVRLRMSPVRPGVLERPGGRTMPAYASASAILFQAYWPEDVHAAFQERYPFWEYGAAIWKTREAFDGAVARTRETGYALLSPDGAGEILMAAPVFGAGDELVAAVGVRRRLGGSVSAEDDIREKLIPAVAELSRRVRNV